ncbi:MAG: yfhJ [Anaerolineales bacterium]|nr:yfhJ [Anaerolineales bacterium]
MSEELYWDSTYALARRLKAEHPDVDLSAVTLNMLYNWAVALPDFKDDPQLANDELLTAILQEWYETRLDNELHANRPADAG